MQITLNNDWQEIADFDCVFQLKTTGYADIALSAATPVVDDGVTIQPLEINRFEYRNNLKLWAKSDRDQAVLEVQGV